MASPFFVFDPKHQSVIQLVQLVRRTHCRCRVGGNKKGAWNTKRLFTVTNLRHLVVVVIVRHRRSFLLLFRLVGDHRFGCDQ